LLRSILSTYFKYTSEIVTCTVDISCFSTAELVLTVHCSCLPLVTCLVLLTAVVMQ